MTNIIDVHVSNLRKLGYKNFDDWDQHSNHVYIGRKVRSIAYNSPWGNPFSVSQYGRDNAVQRYREYILNSPHLLNRLGELRGKTLGCWCGDQPCHGQVLIELMNDPNLSQLSD